MAAPKVLAEWEVVDLKVDGLTGAVAATRYVGGTSSGAPTTGTFAVGDFVVSQAGDVIVCITAGTPGTWLRVARSRGIYGDGSDGTVTLGAGTTTLARDMFYDTLTVPSGAVLNPGQFRVLCRTLCQVDSGGAIRNNGNDASVGVGGVGTGAAATLLSGRNGASGGTGAGTAGTATGGSIPLGGAGGAGGTGASGASGAGGTQPSATANLGHVRSVPMSVLGVGQGVPTGVVTFSAATSGSGGGAGGGDGAGVSGGGGGGGGGVVIAARQLINNGSIESKGGAGGTPGAGNRGGGGGGGGGYLLLTYDVKSGTGTTSVAGGAHGTGTGTGANGVDGSAGTIIEVVNA